MKSRNIKKAIILAGGKGSRIVSVAKEIPKALIKIGGIPVAEHQINLLRKNGIKDVCFLTGHLSNKIENYFQDGRKWGINIRYEKEEKLMGTAGALLSLKDKMKKDFLVFSGDILMDFDIKRFIKFHNKNQGIASILVHPNDHPFDSDLIEVDKEDKIISLFRKPHPEGLIYRNLAIASVYIFSPRIFKYIPRNKKTNIEKDILPKLLKAKEKIYAYNSPEYFKDMGTPKRLIKVRRDYLSGKVQRLSLKNKRKAIFLDRDGVINEEYDRIKSPKDLKIYDFAAEAIKKINDSDYLTIIITNQPIIAKGLLTEKGLRKIHNKLETELGSKGGKIDAIYFCPHHPDKGYKGEIPSLKIRCKCRKPEIGLFSQAKKDLNIDFKKSYFIGDKTSDILAGRKIGCKTVLVETGYAGKDNKFSVKPDFKTDNLLKAIDLIISNKK